MAGVKHLFFEGSLRVGEVVPVPKVLARRMSRVLRLRAGQTVHLFNGVDGVFAAQIEDADCSVLHITACVRPFVERSDSTLLVCLLKRDAMDSVLRQATELGFKFIQPILSEFSVADKVNEERVRALLVEAVEQCERMDVPVVLPLQKLPDVVKAWDVAGGGRIFWAAEQVRGKWGLQNVTRAGDGVLVGCEGGFSAAERVFLNGQACVVPVGLGCEILRADTAVVSAGALFFECFS